MKIIRLTIHNIASIENAVIDFEKGPLADDTRFLICGPLGSGKTTILDAICLALYNTTPRLKSAVNETYTDMRDDFKTSRDDGSVGIDDPRMLMRRGSVKAFVELVFTDRNDNVLTAQWSCSKAREKADGKIQDVRWTLSDASGNEITSKKSETEKEIASRIGLTFEQFSRTTMLAQGEFTRFLKAKDSEKSDILEKLTGTEIYSHISISIHKTMASKKEIHARKEAEMKGVVLMPDEIISETETRIAENIKTQTDLSAQEAGLKEIVSLSEKTAQLAAELSKCAKNKESLLNEFLRLSSGLEYLRDYVCREENIIREAEAFIESEKPLEKVYSDFGRLKVLLAKAATAVKERSKRIDEAEKAGKDAEKLESETGRLAEKWAEAMKADAAIGKKLEEVRKTLTEMDMATLLKQRETAAAELDSAKDYAVLLGKCKAAEENCRRLAEQAEADRQQIESLKKTSSELEKTAAEAAESYRLQEKIYEAQKTACDDILKEIRSRLQQGATCPLCGQHIAHLTKDEEFESVLEPERKKKDELREVYDMARHKADKNNAAIEQLKKTLETSLETAKKVEMECEDLKMNLSLHPIHAMLEGAENVEEALENLRSDKEGIIESLSSMIQTALATQKIADDFLIQKTQSFDSVQKAKEEAEQLHKKIEEKKADKALLIQSAEQLEGEYMTNLAEADTVLAAIPDWQQSWKVSPETFIGDIQTAAARYNAKEEEVRKIRLKLSQCDSVHKSVTACREQILSLYPEWQDSPSPEPCKTEGLQEKWNTLYADAKSLYDHKKRTEDELTGLHAMTEAKGLQDIAAAAAEASSNLIEVQERYKKCSMEIGADTEKLLNDRKQRERLGALAEEAEKAKEDYQQWHRLYEIFGSSDGKKFRNIAQSYVLRQLLAGANSYLRRLTGRYELAGQPGSLTILLKDKEAGGVLRPTSTISGGESFLTSLALALGLSSLSNRSASMDILFIDEGFGTLDSTYLGTVMDTLEQLHQMGGRKIGIISHVESLKERLTTQIQVVRVNSTLSRIEVKSIL